MSAFNESLEMASAEVSLSADDGDVSVWKDRTDDSSDLKRTFSRAQPDSPLPSEVVARAHMLCAQYLGGAWKAATREQFTIHQMTGGMSNLLFLVSLSPSLPPTVAAEPRRALLRIHCQTDIDQLLSESVVFTLLSERCLGPKLLGVFPGGRFEQFIPSRPLACDEISDEKMIRKIAPMLARVHSLHVPIGKDPQLLIRARGWLSKWSETASGKAGVDISCCKASVPSDKFPAHVSSADLLAELDFVQRFLDASNSPIVFSHNDLQEGNILLVDKEDDEVVSDNTENEDMALIDFEYCDYNYRGFDLGNHFCEHGLDYSFPEHPFYTIHQDRWEDSGHRRLFAQSYRDELVELSKESPVAADLMSLDGSSEVSVIEEEARLFQAISHIFWACWALLNKEECSIPFGYSEYARDRLALYFERKPLLEQFLRDH